MAWLQSALGGVRSGARTASTRRFDGAGQPGRAPRRSREAGAASHGSSEMPGPDHRSPSLEGRQPSPGGARRRRGAGKNERRRLPPY